MPDKNHLDKFSSPAVVKIHFGHNGEGVDQSTEIKFCIRPEMPERGSKTSTVPVI
jgi:hypothetical protein